MASSHEVHPVARAVGNSYLGYSFSHRPNFPWIAQGQTPDTNVDSYARLPVSKPTEPASIYVGLANLGHRRAVFYRIPPPEGQRTIER